MAADDIKLGLKFGSRTFDDAAQGVMAFAGTMQAAWEGEFEQVRGALLDYLNHVAEILVGRHSGGWPGGTSGSSLSSRSGTGVASITRSVKVSGTSWASLKGAIGGAAYLAIHETGGTFTGSGGKLLTIPLPAAMNGRGVAPPFARQWKNTFVARSRKGNLIIFQKRGGAIVPLYLLVPSVSVKARLGMGSELGTQLPYFMERALDSVGRDFMNQLGK